MEDWHSRWFADKNFFIYLKEDFQIRKILYNKFKEASIESINIERSPNQVQIIISSARPGLIIGRGGQEVEKTKEELQKKILDKTGEKKEKRNFKIEIQSIKNPWLSASLSAQWIAQRIEKRVPFRRVLKQAVSMAMSQKEVLGARVQISGRLNGNTIARTEWLQKGRMPRQTIRADIDYGFKEAFCTYGVIGVKVWLYKGEKF